LARTVALLLGVHAHQPVGNFESVLDDAMQRCYGPFLRVLYQYPNFRFSMHVSGWLLEYLLKHFPHETTLLKEMVQRGQTELFGAGYTEPVLASIPARDRIGQIRKLSRYIEENFGLTPHGAWLTERVWECSVVPALADSGIRYVTVDDYHFLCTGQPNQGLNGYYTTEEDGRSIKLFPISEALRYRLPFSPAHEAVAYLEGMADESGESAAIYFDDIEKFGIWPETYEWVYERGWLRNFIEGVLNSPVIQPMLYSQYEARARTRGVVYLPTTSYIEMNEWTLPAAAAHQYADLIQEQRDNGQYDRNKPFIRGGIWRNFFMRYPESNWMHKRMLALSARYNELPEKKRTAAMTEALYEAQANDAYWHGLFGGLYLPHLRRAVFNAILRLEALLDNNAPRPPQSQSDIDMDGHDEIFLQNGLLQAVIRLDGSASICELGSYRLLHNFADTLTRQPEHYHRKINMGASHEDDAEGISNPHERISFRHEILPEDLAIDTYGKTMFRDFWCTGGNEDPVQYTQAGSPQHGLMFHSEQQGVRKRVNIEDESLLVAYAFPRPSGDIFRVEINLAMPSCDGPAGRLRVADEILGGFGQRHERNDLREISLEDEVLGGALHLHISEPCLFVSTPHFSVSQSEAGFEKIMQAVTLELSWPAEALTEEIFIRINVV
jgi:4-alpha-glucanotransferase